MTYDDDLADLIGEAPPLAPFDRRARRRFQPWTHEEYLRLEPTPWLVGDDDRPGLIAKGLWVTFGLFKSGKTFWELEKAFCVAFGIEFHGLPVTQGRVAYVCAEGDVKRIMERVIALCVHHKVDRKCIGDGRFNLITSAVNLLETEGELGVDTLLMELTATEDDGGPYAAVWLDTWAQMLAAGGGHDTDAETVMPAVRGCMRIREALNCSVVIVAHVGYAASAQDRPKGLSDLPGAVDGGTKIEKKGDGLGAIHTATAKVQRYAADGFVQSAKLVAAGPGHVMQSVSKHEAGLRELSPDHRRALDILRNMGDDAVLLDTWRAACEREGVFSTTRSGDTIKNWRSKWNDELAKLVSGGHVKVDNGVVEIDDLS